jgi:hypothetical protein
MPVLSYLHQLFNAERCQAYIHELGAVAFRSDQGVQLLDLVAQGDGERMGLQRTGVADGSHGRAS